MGLGEIMKGIELCDHVTGLGHETQQKIEERRRKKVVNF